MPARVYCVFRSCNRKQTLLSKSQVQAAPVDAIAGIQQKMLEIEEVNGIH